MINVEIYISRKECKLTVQGHSGYNPGNDIVCAGCSSITGMVAGYFINHNKGVVENELHSGYAKIHIKGNVKKLFEMVLIGFLQIEQSYPQNIKISYTYI